MDFIIAYFTAFVVLIIIGILGALKSPITVFILESVVFVLFFVFRDFFNLINTTNALIFVLTYVALLITGAIGYSVFKNSESIIFPQVFVFAISFAMFPFIFGVV